MNAESSLKVALITGGARGIGFACAQRFVREGWAAAIVDIDGEAAKGAAATLSREDGRAIAVTADVRNHDDVENAVTTTVREFGALTTLVNNAGIIQPEPSVEVSEEHWDRMLGIHLKGAFLFCQASYPHLRATEGASVVNMASIAGFIGIPQRLTYCVSKAGLTAMSRVLAVEWAPDGIRANAVAPGWTETTLVRQAIDVGVLDVAKLNEKVPLGRLAREEEMAGAVYFLASKDASFITGQTLIVDGGFTIDGRV